jgi:hypothetical protein
MANTENETEAIGIGVNVPTFTFTLDSFRITDTRSRHEDTDFVSCTLQVKSANASGTPKTQTKSMGNLNNGTFKVGLSFPNVSVGPNQTAVFNYLIINSGHKSESAIYTALENAGGACGERIGDGGHRDRIGHLTRTRDDSWGRRGLAGRRGQGHTDCQLRRAGCR